MNTERYLFVFLAFLVLGTQGNFTTAPLQARQVNEQAISLSWAAATDPVDAYNVMYRRAGTSDPFEVLFVTRETTALISHIPHSVALQYQVEVDGSVSLTNTRTLTAPAFPLPNPATLPPAPVVTEVSSTQAFFTWTAFGQAPYVVEAFLGGEWKPVFSDGDPEAAPHLYAVIPVELPGVPLSYRVTSPTNDISTPAVVFATSAAANDFGFDPAKGALKLTTVSPELVVAYSDTNTGSVNPSSFELSLTNNAQALVRYNLDDPSLNLCDVLYARLVFPGVVLSSGTPDGGFFRVYADLEEQWSAATTSATSPAPKDPNFFTSSAQALSGAVSLDVNLDTVLPGGSGAVVNIQSWIDGGDNNGFLITYQTSLNTVLEVLPPVLEFASFTPLSGFLGFGGLDFQPFSPTATCIACNGPAVCSTQTDFASATGTINDLGQVPVTSTLISMNVRVKGTWNSGLNTRFAVAVAGVLVEEKFVSGTDVVCTNSVCDIEIFQSPEFLPQVGGWPGWNYGGPNELTIIFDGEICVHEVSFDFTYLDREVTDPNCAPPSPTPTPTITPSRTPSNAISVAPVSPSPTPPPPTSLPSATRSPAQSPEIQGPSQTSSPLPDATQAPSASVLFQAPTPSPFPSPSRSPLGCIGINNGQPQCQPLPTIAPIPDDGDDTLVLVTDPAGEPVGSVIIPPESVPEGSDVVITPVNVFPDQSPNLSIPVDIKIFRDGREVPLIGEIEICLTVERGDIDDSCLGFINDEGEWECQDNCLKEKNGQLCGTTDHLTSFAVLFSGGAGDECGDSSDQYIFDELWQDLLMMALVAAFIVCCLFSVCVLLVVVPGGSRLVYGEEGSRIRSIRNQTGSLRVDPSYMEETAGSSGGVTVEEL